MSALTKILAVVKTVLVVVKLVKPDVLPKKGPAIEKLK